MEMKLSTILEGKRAGPMQRVGIMQIIPIFYQSKDLINYGIATPNQNMKVMKNRDYGEMNFENKDQERMLITPTNLGIMTKQSAQDHAMTKTGLIAPGGKVTYRDAVCIESSRPGYINDGSYDFVVLPYSLRKKALSLKGSTGYSRLWQDISQFNCDLGINTANSNRAHLSDFYTTFDDQLNKFIAQFENLPDQIGAIILISDEVVGVEIAPNPEYWSEVWEPLIRSCYGSETVKRLLKDPKAAEKSRVTDSRITGATSLAELESAVQKFEDEQENQAKGLVAAISEQKLATSVEQSTVVHGKTYQLIDVKAQKFVGQAVTENNFVVYASIVANAKKMLAKRSFAF